MSASTGEESPAENRFDPRYLSFFEEFNRQRYFEAHEVLEGLWLETRDSRREFYKALIQVAAVFLKLQQEKPAPAQRLAARALSHLEAFRPRCEGVDLEPVAKWLRDVIDGRSVPAGQQLMVSGNDNS